MATLHTGTPEHERSQSEFEPFVDADTTISPSTAVKFSDYSRTVANHFLGILSTATNQQVIVILGGLSVVAIVVLGRFGALLVGLVAGFLLHASWDSSHDTAQDGPSTIGLRKRRHETGIEVANRLLGFSLRSSTTKQPVDDLAVKDQIKATGDGKLDFAHFPPATAGALRVLTDAVIDNYVKWWYGPILPSEETFPGSCRILLNSFIISASAHLTRKRPADTFLHFVTNSSSMIIVFLSELSTALSSTNLDAFSPKDIVKEYLEENPDCSLANVLDESQQRKKLNMVADDIIAAFLDRKAYNCQVVRDFLRETFAGLVLESVITKFAQPEYINDWIIYLLREGEPEILNAIDAGLEQPSKDQKLNGMPSATGREAENRDTITDSKAANFDMTYLATQDVKVGTVGSKDNDGQQVVPELCGTKNIQDAHIANHTAGGGSASNSEPLRSTRSESRRGTLMRQSSVSSTDPASTLSRLGEEAASPLTDEVDNSRPLFSASVALESSEDLTAPNLHGASVSIYDCSDVGDRAPLKSKPLSEYSLQIEPVSARQPGWIIFRHYSDFETLHEGLSAISRINNIHTFTNRHATLPTWKGHTRRALAQDLQDYVQDALSHKLLADSARIKKFLEKERGVSSDPPSSSKAVFSFPRSAAFENMGKGMLEALSNAPKGVAGGGKAVFEGVSGVFGGVTTKKPQPSVRNRESDLNRAVPVSSRQTYSRQSDDRSSRASSSTSNLFDESNSRQASVSTPEEQVIRNVTDDSSHRLTRALSCEDSTTVGVLESTSGNHLQNAGSPAPLSALQTSSPSGMDLNAETAPASTPSDLRRPTSAGDTTFSTHDKGIDGPISSGAEMKSRSSTAAEKSHNLPLTEDETRVAVELIFAVINELYTLSSAWNFRKTLLNAAKSYILRPGNPSLEGIRALIQESMIDAQTSDEAIAAHIIKLRENSLPTEEELSLWPAPPGEEEKARMRTDARKLFMERGMPQALMGIMGAGATNEALGRIFDCLQSEEIARGFMFALVLQALRAIII